MVVTGHRRRPLFSCCSGHRRSTESPTHEEMVSLHSAVFCPLSFVSAAAAAVNGSTQRATAVQFSLPEQYKPPIFLFSSLTAETTATQQLRSFGSSVFAPSLLPNVVVLAVVLVFTQRRSTTQLDLQEEEEAHWAQKERKR